ncbi:family 90 glycosyltransferase [Cryphonectria parasitica EP155]|uniref:Family 90 glycosyltransferase n=1 Tax=Cryphonectria parasitica (strain ATCC 38755 / EP155) TaxID=660469 RepID=A0A9P4YAB8_CRYP1|nr:family 90 glycosyltransferase [Cryphonectria parasitica EP155]KAF3769403.1 family 90 glycosyltransferase [Cryphonectria parasitica EP155]
MTMGGSGSLFVFLVGTLFLSSRYYTTSTLERPIALSALTLFWTALALLFYSRWHGGSERISTAHHVRSYWRHRSIWGLSQTLAIPACLVARAFFFRQTLWWSQCTVPGAHTFLLTLVLVAERYLPHQQRDEVEEEGYMQLATSKLSANSSSAVPPSSPWAKGAEQTNHHEPDQRPSLQYIACAVAWAFLASRSLASVQTSTGAVCPANAAWLGVMPQLATLGLDAVLVLLVARRLRWHQQTNTEPAAAAVGSSAPISNSSSSSRVNLEGDFLVAAAVMCLLLLLSAPNSTSSFRELVAAPSIRSLALRELLQDSIATSLVLLTAINLLAHHITASTLCLCSGAAVVASFQNCWLALERGAIHLAPHSTLWPLTVGALTIGSVALLGREATRLDGEVLRLSAGDRMDHKKRLMGAFAGMVLFLWIGLVRLSLASSSPDLDVHALIASARKASDTWISAAHQSQTLHEAVAEYKNRYGIPPPPHFDKWYAFATQHNSPVIDAFDQIHSDLRPFWGMSPGILRARTSHLMEQTHLGMGGLRIQNKTIILSDLTPGTHRWMMEGYRAMMEPFVAHLPDMDLAFNLDDESRVVMTFERYWEHVADGELARTRLARSRDVGRPLRSSFSAEVWPPWSDAYLHLTQDDHPPFSEYFSERSRLPIYDTFVVPACPPSSPARRYRWTDNAVVSSSARGGDLFTSGDNIADLCNRPDLANLHGFLLNPGAFAVTQHALPIFSQARAEGAFSDILVPSPWNFVGKVDLDPSARDPEWADKADVVFWRGSATDGYAREATWPGYLRARFVSMARSLSSSSRPSTAATTTTANVSFVGAFSRCDVADCLAETATFYGASTAEPTSGSIDFQDHWAYRHLIDLDGAGFSGRFLPFLRSKSLVYKASLFRTWADERLHAWSHYVPLDVSLGGFWDVVKFVSGRDTEIAGEGNGEEGMGSSSMSLAESIAGEGRNWALRALRPEDMQVYMFRLLLEWGRLLDDSRDQLGFSA